MSNKNGKNKPNLNRFLIKIGIFKTIVIFHSELLSRTMTRLLTDHKVSSIY